MLISSIMNFLSHDIISFVIFVDRHHDFLQFSMFAEKSFCAKEKMKQESKQANQLVSETFVCILYGKYAEMFVFDRVFRKFGQIQ